MNKLKFITLIFTGFLLVFCFSTVKAQDENSLDDGANPNQKQQQRRPNLLAELDLTKEQIQQIRRINREMQPLKRAARQRMVEANQSLDQAIYDDKFDESIIEARLKDAQLAQAEFTKINSMTESAVRKILLPEQLVKFREIRRNFKERNLNRQNRQTDAPNQRLQNRRRNLRQNN